MRGVRRLRVAAEVLRLTLNKRRAITVLFHAGFSFREVGRLFKLPSLTVENIVRDYLRANRRRK